MAPDTLLLPVKKASLGVAVLQEALKFLGGCSSRAQGGSNTLTDNATAAFAKPDRGTAFPLAPTTHDDFVAVFQVGALLSTWKHDREHTLLCDLKQRAA